MSAVLKLEAPVDIFIEIPIGEIQIVFSILYEVETLQTELKR